MYCGIRKLLVAQFLRVFLIKECYILKNLVIIKLCNQLQHGRHYFIWFHGVYMCDVSSSQEEICNMITDISNVVLCMVCVINRPGFSAMILTWAHCCSGSHFYLRYIGNVKLRSRVSTCKLYGTEAENYERRKVMQYITKTTRNSFIFINENCLYLHNWYMYRNINVSHKLKLWIQ